MRKTYDPVDPAEFAAAVERVAKFLAACGPCKGYTPEEMQFLRQQPLLKKATPAPVPSQCTGTRYNGGGEELP